MTDPIQIAREYREQLSAEILKLEEFLRYADRVIERSEREHDVTRRLLNHKPKLRLVTNDEPVEAAAGA